MDEKGAEHARRVGRGGGSAGEEGGAKVEQAWTGVVGRPVTLRFGRTDAQGSGAAGSLSPSPTGPSTAARRREELEGDPMVRKVVELFEARPLHLEYEDEAS